MSTFILPCPCASWFAQNWKNPWIFSVSGKVLETRFFLEKSLKREKSLEKSWKSWFSSFDISKVVYFGSLLKYSEQYFKLVPYLLNCTSYSMVSRVVYRWPVCVRVISLLSPKTRLQQQTRRHLHFALAMHVCILRFIGVIYRSV